MNPIANGQRAFGDLGDVLNESWTSLFRQSEHGTGGPIDDDANYEYEDLITPQSFDRRSLWQYDKPGESVSVYEEDMRFDLGIVEFAIALLDKPVLPETLRNWLMDGKVSAEYLIYLLTELKMHFPDAIIELEFRKDDISAPFKVLIHGTGDPDAEAELLWQFEDKLMEKGLYPLDHGVSLIDL